MIGDDEPMILSFGILSFRCHGFVFERGEFLRFHTLWAKSAINYCYDAARIANLTVVVGGGVGMCVSRLRGSRVGKGEDFDLTWLSFLKNHSPPATSSHRWKPCHFNPSHTLNNVNRKQQRIMKQISIKPLIIFPSVSRHPSHIPSSIPAVSRSLSRVNILFSHFSNRIE